MGKSTGLMTEIGSKPNTKKATTGLTEEQYFFLKEKVLEVQKHTFFPGEFDACVGQTVARPQSPD
jgi:hypothetical protein